MHHKVTALMLRLAIYVLLRDKISLAMGDKKYQILVVISVITHWLIYFYIILYFNILGVITLHTRPWS